ncbi:MAG: hypothetical protein M1826_002704 [Phylliscum demangeonii]|nr:MAG: hypothetical protein M1826_002704 [Phylliscum demangeonii]
MLSLMPRSVLALVLGLSAVTFAKCPTVTSTVFPPNCPRVPLFCPEFLCIFRPPQTVTAACLPPGCKSTHTATSTTHCPTTCRTCPTTAPTITVSPTTCSTPYADPTPTSCYTATTTVPHNLAGCPAPPRPCILPQCILESTTFVPCPTASCSPTPTITRTLPCQTACRVGCATFTTTVVGPSCAPTL